MTETLENRVLDRILDDIDALPERPKPPTSDELASAVALLKRWLETRSEEIDVLSQNGLTIAVAMADRRLELVKAVEDIADDEAQRQEREDRQAIAFGESFGRVLRRETPNDDDWEAGGRLMTRNRPDRFETV